MQTGRAYQIHMLGDSADRGLMYGEACFETLRVVRGTIFRWPEHLARLGRGAAAFGWDAPAGAPLHDACLQAAGGVGDDALLRLTMTGGQAPWGLVPTGQPEMHIQAMSYVRPAGPLHLRGVDWPFPAMERPAKFSADYAQSLRALVHWRRAGLLVGGEQPLVCADDRILGGISANVLLYRDGCWLSPEDGSGVLAGIVRQALIEVGVVTPCPCPAAWLADCESMAMTNAGVFIRPVSAIDGRRLDTDEARFASLWRVLAAEGAPA